MDKVQREREREVQRWAAIWMILRQKRFIKNEIRDYSSMGKPGPALKFYFCHLLACLIDALNLRKWQTRFKLLCLDASPRPSVLFFCCWPSKSLMSLPSSPYLHESFSPRLQVQQLIQDATDTERLCQMFPGWGAWLWEKLSFRPPSPWYLCSLVCIYIRYDSSVTVLNKISFFLLFFICPSTPQSAS